MATDGTPADAPVSSRGDRLANAPVARMVSRGVRPNQVSLLGLGFGVIAAVAIALSVDLARRWQVAVLLVAVAAFVG